MVNCSLKLNLLSLLTGQQIIITKRAKKPHKEGIFSSAYGVSIWRLWYRRQLVLQIILWLLTASATWRCLHSRIFFTSRRTFQSNLFYTGECQYYHTEILAYMLYKVVLQMWTKLLVPLYGGRRQFSEIAIIETDKSNKIRRNRNRKK